MKELFSKQTTALVVSSILCSAVAILSNTTMLLLLLSVTDSVYGFHTNRISLVYNTRSIVLQSLSATTTHTLSNSRNNKKCHNGINVIGNNNKDSMTSLSMISPTDVVSFSSFISTKYHTKKGAVELIHKLSAGGKAAATSTTLVPTLITETSPIVVSESAQQIVAVVAGTTTAGMVSPVDIEGEVITDTAIALCDGATFLPDMKTSKLRIKYAQVIGRILFIDVSLLPGHTFHPEELAIQLFLLGASLQPILRSIRLFRCRRDAMALAACGDDDAECILDYDDLGSIYDDDDCELECTFIDITIENENDNKNEDHDHDTDTFN
mmetsp:Transcript_32232/g.35860  ORF Transcript_32232/g.35860 Transcript_32232/m.35860 type:complete len:324 (-) Transcript_32232:354-1325(-)